MWTNSFHRYRGPGWMRHEPGNDISEKDQRHGQEDALDPLDGYDGAEDALEPLGGVGDADLQGRTGTPPVDPAAGGRSTIGLDESFFQVG